MELNKKCVVKYENSFVLATVTKVDNSGIFTEDDTFDVVLSGLTEMCGIISDKYRPLIFGLEKFSIEWYKFRSIVNNATFFDICRIFKVECKIGREDDNQWFNIFYDGILVFRSNTFSDGVYYTYSHDITEYAECAMCFILEAVFNKDISKINTLDFCQQICKELEEKQP
jgi:hypothetical protein